METAIRFFVMNFTLTFLLLGLLCSGASLLLKPRPWSSGVIVEALLSYFILWSIGVSFLYNTIVHIVFGDIAASFIGWAHLPFQYKVRFASLRLAVIALLASRGSFAVCPASIVIKDHSEDSLRAPYQNSARIEER